MSLLKYASKLTEEEQERFVQYKHFFRYDDFTMPWIAFVSKYPLPKKLKDAFDKMETSSERIGILSKWLIKVAKKEGVSQGFIDLYWQAKHDKNYWYDQYGKWINEELKKSEENPDDIDVVFRATKNITRHDLRRKDLRHNLNHLSIKLIDEVL